MKRVFISYSRTDEKFARQLAVVLAQAGADVWIDIEDIPPGIKWSTAIQEGLDTADAMLLIVSPHSMSSANVEDEWHYFMDADKPIIPLMLKPTKIHFQLNRLQWVDFHNQRFEDAFNQLTAFLNEKNIPLISQLYEPSPDDTAPVEPIQTFDPKITSTTEQIAQNSSPSSQQVRIITLVAVVIFMVAGVGAMAVLQSMGASAEQQNLDNINLFSRAAPALFYQTDALTVHQSPEGSTETNRLSNVYINVRTEGDDGEIWYQAISNDTDEEGWQIARNIPDFNESEAQIPPFLDPMFESVPQLLAVYPEAGINEDNIVFDFDATVGFAGFNYDAEGQLWYLLDFFVPPENDSFLGWVIANQVVPLPVTAIEVPFVEMPLVTQTNIPNAPLFALDDALDNVRVAEQTGVIDDLYRDDVYILDVARTADGTEFAYIGLVEEENNTWAFAWAVIDTLELNDADIDYLETWYE